MIKQRQAGFTLVEVLVTIAIVALLASIGLASFAQAGISGRNSKRKADIESIRQALVMYRADAGSYPIQGSVGLISSGVQTVLTTDYLAPPFPTDPKSTGSSIYTYISTAGTSFCLCALMEGTGQGNTNVTNCTAFSPGGTHYCAESP